MKGWNGGFQSPTAHSGFRPEEQAEAEAGAEVGAGHLLELVADHWSRGSGCHQSPLTLPGYHAGLDLLWWCFGALRSKGHKANRRSAHSQNLRPRSVLTKNVLTSHTHHCHWFGSVHRTDGG